MEYPDKSDGAYPIRAARSARKAFVLWQEVCMAYVSPTVMASIGGLITADKNLQIGEHPYWFRGIQLPTDREQAVRIARPTDFIHQQGQRSAPA